MKKAKIAIVSLGHYIYFNQFEGLREELMAKSEDFKKYLDTNVCDVFDAGYVNCVDATFAVSIANGMDLTPEFDDRFTLFRDEKNGTYLRGENASGTIHSFASTCSRIYIAFLWLMNYNLIIVNFT